jgi:hypothetical protein
VKTRSWSAVSTLILLVLALAGIAQLTGGHAAGGIACLVLAAAYIPVRLLRGMYRRPPGTGE